MRNYYDDISWSFLIASPSRTGDFFDESVILLLEDNEDGAFGIAINKAGGRKLGEISDEFVSTPLEEVEIFDGGPVGRETISLAVCTYDADDENGGSFSFGTSPQNAISEIENNPDAKVAAFSGYAGWGPKQLQSEISEGEWIVCNADINMVFDIPPEHLWRELLLKQCPAYQTLPTPSAPPALN